MGYWLSDTGLDVVIVEKHRIGSGSTSANTAFIQFTGEKTAHQLVNSFGETLALRHLTLCKEAIEEMEKAASMMHVDPSFTRRGSLNTASRKEDIPLLQKDYELLRRHGFPLDFWTETEIARRYPFRRPAALYSYDDAECNPDGLPMIGIYEDIPRCTFLFPYGDNGIVYGMVLSRIIRDYLLHGHSPDLDLYLQTRPLWKKRHAPA